VLLQDKIAIVTGAATGLSKAIARTFALEGAWLAVTDFDQTVADDAARVIDPSGRRVMGVAMDVADEQQVGAAIAKVVHAFGGLDILVSNPGIQIESPRDGDEFLHWKRTLSRHLDGAFLTARAALRHMYKQKSGCIIYVGGFFSKEMSLNEAPYVAAAHGLIGLAKVVASDGAAHGVRANVICPSFVGTATDHKPMLEHNNLVDPFAGGLFENLPPTQTAIDAFPILDDVAETALFLASFGSIALTGQSILVNRRLPSE
jgi:3-hydroxybutyrate dehydrogenase